MMSKFSKRCLNFLILSILCASSLMAIATPLPRYQIEMILFKYTDTHLTHPTEKQSTPFALPAQHRLLIANDQANSPEQSFVKCRPNQFTLAKEADALAQQNHLQVIEHIAWQATGDELNQSSPIAICAGNELQVGDKHKTELQGSIRIKKDAFFHIKTDFVLNQQDDLAYSHHHGEYVLLDNELHYFDSENLGILMKIIKL